jgi:hypothetical protein
MIRYVASIACIIATLVSSEQVNAQNKKPNIVVILTCPHG